MTSSSPLSSPLTSFPIKARVILHGLLNAPELNNQIGIVQSGILLGDKKDRQQVHIAALDKHVALKRENMKYEPRPLDSLSIKELKVVLKYKNPSLDPAEYTGLSKSELRQKVSDAVMKTEEQTTNEEAATVLDEIAHILALAQAPYSKSSEASNGNGNDDRTSSKSKRNKKQPASASTSSNNSTSALEQLSQMSPEQLHQQAQMMKCMNPAEIRRMNPGLSHMTDDQIRQAADQMEMMANNPAMMQQAKEQMKNMDPAELERLQRGGEGGVSSGIGNNNNSMLEQQIKAMANMTPEQMKDKHFG
jgi:hypothetical protein